MASRRPRRDPIGPREGPAQSTLNARGPASQRLSERNRRYQPARKHGAAQANCCADAGVHCQDTGPARVVPLPCSETLLCIRAGCGISSITFDPVASALSDAGWGHLSTHGHNTCYGKRKCTSATRLGSRRCDDRPQAGLLPALIGLTVPRT